MSLLSRQCAIEAFNSNVVVGHRLQDDEIGTMRGH